MPPHILISGYYGCGNIGDEAVLAGLLAGFRRLCPAAEISVLSANPAATTALHGVRAAPRCSLSAVREELAGSQLFVSGGGGLLQDTTSWRSPLYYLGLLWMARRRGIPAVALCQGIGPLRRGWLRRLSARVFRSLDLIVVREEASAQLLADMGLPRADIHVAADAAWLMESAPPPEVAALLERESLHLSSPMVGVFVRGLSTSAELWEAIAAGLGEFLRRHLARSMFVPLQKPGDTQASQAVMKRLGAPASILAKEHSPAALLGLTGRFDLVVGMRLHGLILAAHAGVPAVGISYDPKVAAFLRQAGLKQGMSVESPRSASLLEALERTWLEREQIRQSLASLKEENRHKVLQAIERALALSR